MPYSAGTVFLEVVPSFHNVQRQTAKAGKDAGASFEKGLDPSIKSVEKKLGKAGADGGGAFATGMSKQVAKAMKDLKVRLEIDEKPLDRDLARLIAKIEAFSKVDFRVTPGVDSKSALTQLRKFEIELERFKKNESLDIDLRVNAGTAQRDLGKIREQVRIALGATKEQIAAERELERERVKNSRLREQAQARFDRAERQRKAQQAAEDRRAAAETRRNEAKAERERTRDQAEEYRQRTTELRRELNRQNQAYAEAKRAQSRASSQAQRTGDVDPFLSASRSLADAEMARVRARFELEEHLSARTSRKLATDAEITAAIQRGADNEALREAMANDILRAASDKAMNIAMRREARETARQQNSSLRQLWNQNIGQAANSFRLFNGALLTAIALGPLLIPVLAGIAAGMGAIALMGTAALAGVGVLVAGLGGIGGALQAIGAVRKERGRQAVGSKSDNGASALRGLRDAQLALARAREDAGQRTAAAAERQAQAERTLTKAVTDAADAQRDLVRARQSAADQLEDMNARLAGGKLDEQLGAFALQEAGFRFNNVLEDDQASGREKEIARLEYEQAKLQFAELQRSNRRLAEEVADANAKGVEGSDEVVQAKAAIVDAEEAIGNAQKDVADSHRDYARAQVEEARTLADAEQGVADAMVAVQQASVEAGVAGSAAMDQLREAMEGLSPAGQDFAYFLYGLKPLLDDIRAAAQGGLLPGLQQGIQTLVDAFGPGFISFIADISKVMGDLFAAAGEALTAPFWRDFFGMIAKYAPGLLRDLGIVIGALATMFAGVIAAFLPYAPQIGAFFVGIAEGLAEWGASLGGSKGFERFMDFVAATGPKVFELLGLIVEVLLKLAIGLAPYADKLLDFLIGFIGWLAEQDPQTLALWAGGLLALVGAIQVFAGLLAFSSSILGLITGIAGAVALLGGGAGIAALAGAAAPIIGIVAAVVAVIAIIIGLIFWIKHLWETNEEFRDRVKAIWQNIVDAFTFVSGIVVGYIMGIVGIFRDVLFPILQSWYYAIIKPVIDLIVGIFQVLWSVVSTIFNMIYQIITFIVAPAFMWFYDHIIKPWWETKVQPILDAFGNFFKDTIVPKIQAAIDVIGAIWNTLLEIFKAPIRFLIETVLNRGIIDTFNRLVDIFPGMTKVDHVAIPAGLAAAQGGGGGGRPNQAFASGGVLPGYTPGRDVHSFYSPTAGRLDLSGGEGIARPEIVRALGKRRWDAMNAAARGGNVRGALGYLGGYSDGGVLGWLGRAASGAGDTISGIAGSISNLLTDPAGILRSIVSALVGAQTSTFGKLLTAVPMKLIDGIAGFMDSMLGKDRGENAPVSGSGIGWQRMSAIIQAAFPGIAITSAFRPGAITAVGTRSYHALGRAIDMSPRMDAFQWLSANFPGSRELFYTPAGTQNWILNGGKGSYNPAPVTVADHNDHVHWAYHDGGIVPNLYDTGGELPPGLSFIANRTGKPEHVLTDAQLSAVAQGSGSRRGAPETEINVERMGADAYEVAHELETIRRDRVAAYGLDRIGTTT